MKEKCTWKLGSEYLFGMLSVETSCGKKFSINAITKTTMEFMNCSCGKSIQSEIGVL